MVDIRLKIAIKEGLSDSAKRKLLIKIGDKIRSNLSVVKDIAEDGVNIGVKASNSNFIATDAEAAELGVGVGGSIDTERTEGAWRQMLTGSSEGVTTVDVTSDSRPGKIANIHINVDEDALFAAHLSTVDTEDSDQIGDIPWLQWLIEGAPSIQGYRFDPDEGRGFSRTGQGRMILSSRSIWSFPPARQGAFNILIGEIEKQVDLVFKRDIDRII